MIMKINLITTKYITKFIILTLFVLVMPTSAAFAQPAPSSTVGAGGITPATSGGAGGVTPPKKSTLTNPLRNIDTLGGLVNKFVELFSYIVIIFAVLILIWTGLQYIMARGNTTKMKELTARLGWIVVGIAIVIGARVIITVIVNTLEATGTVNEEVIRSVNRAVDGR